MLTAEDIEEFKQLVKRETGIELTDEEASDRANKLVNLVAMLTTQEAEPREATLVLEWGGG